MNNKITTLAEAKELLRSEMDKGAICPCCNQSVKMYRWKISAKIGAVLIAFYHQRNKWIHPLNDLGVNSGDYAKLRHFGLIVSSDHIEEDKKASGLWTITPRGIAFVEDRLTIHEKVKLYNNAAYGFEGSQVTIHDVLGSSFSYSELMNDQGESSTGNDKAI
jgi:hypothetical protein